MKIVVQNGGQAFAHILAAVKRDPSSWGSWNVLYINTTKEPEDNTLPANAYVVNQAGLMGAEIDGVAYLVDSQQLFIVCRDTELPELRSLGIEICTALFEQYSIAASHSVYRLTHDWRFMAETCPAANSQYAFEPQADDALGELHQTLDIMHDILELNLVERRLRSAMRILLVEDDAVARKIFSRCLSPDQHLITSDNARDAVTQYALHAPNIVFLDIGLPDFSGHTVLEAIQAYDPDAYVVIFSGNSYIENVACALAAGASGFIEKPFRKERLTHYLKHYQAENPQQLVHP